MCPVVHHFFSAVFNQGKQRITRNGYSKYFIAQSVSEVQGNYSKSKQNMRILIPFATMPGFKKKIIQLNATSNIDSFNSPYFCFRNIFIMAVH